MRPNHKEGNATLSQKHQFGPKWLVFFPILMLSLLGSSVFAQKFKKIHPPDSIADLECWGVHGVIGEKLIFSGYSQLAQNGPMLFTLDPTKLGTTDYKQSITPVFELNYYIHEYCILGDNFYFTTSIHPENGVYQTFQRLDPATNTVSELYDFQMTNPNISGLFKFGDNLIFAGESAAEGVELWISDGTTAGTRLLVDIFPGPVSSNPGNFMPFGNKFMFEVLDSTLEPELWISDGTASGTLPIIRFEKNCLWANFESHAYDEINNLLYFNAFDSLHGNEPWRTDGTPAGTYMLKDIFPGPGSSICGKMSFENGKLLFFANDREMQLPNTSYPTIIRELYTSDGTSNGTISLTDELSYSPHSPYFLYSLSGKTYFSAPKPSDSQKMNNFLWETDGSSAAFSPLNGEDNYSILIETASPHPSNSNFWIEGYDTSSSYVWEVNLSSDSRTLIEAFPHSDSTIFVREGNFVGDYYILEGGVFYFLKYDDLNNEQNLNDLNLTIFPVPFDDEINIQWDGILELPLEMEMWDPLGRLVFEYEITDYPQLRVQNLGHLAAGPYFLKIRNNSSEITRRLVKQK